MYVTGAVKSTCRPVKGHPVMVFPVLLLLWPLVEIALFVTVGSAIGLWATLAIVIGTGILGVWLIRREGQNAGVRLRQAMAARSDPGAGLAETVLGLGSGILLILPGFLTDALGVLLLIPAVRKAVAAALARRAGAGRVVWTDGPGARPMRDAPDVIDGTWEELPSDETRPPPPPSGWTRP
jgi:UPF0716 protein FxsA